MWCRPGISLLNVSVDIAKKAEASERFETWAGGEEGGLSSTQPCAYPYPTQIFQNTLGNLHSV